MKILMTGATGFVGSRASRGLVDDGHVVFALIRAGSDRGRLDRRIAVVEHDGQTETLARSIENVAPDVCVHCAARFVAVHQTADVDALIESNLNFGAQLLEALGRAGTRRFVTFGTAWQHFHTDDYQPVSLYAATKQAFRDLAQYYIDAQGWQAIELQLSDTYGPGDTRGKVIALLVNAARDGRRLAMSPGEQIVNFVHIDDVVQAVRIAIARTEELAPGAFESVSLRGEENLTLRSFAALVAEIAGLPVDIDWGARPYRPREVMQPWLGPLLPGWHPRRTIQDGLREVINEGR